MASGSSRFLYFRFEARCHEPEGRMERIEDCGPAFLILPGRSSRVSVETGRRKEEEGTPLKIRAEWNRPTGLICALSKRNSFL